MVYSASIGVAGGFAGRATANLEASNPDRPNCATAGRSKKTQRPRFEIPSLRIPTYEAICASEIFALNQPVFGAIGTKKLDPAHIDKRRTRTQAAVGVGTGTVRMGIGHLVRTSAASRDSVVWRLTDFLADAMEGGPQQKQTLLSRSIRRRGAICVGSRRVTSP